MPVFVCSSVSWDWDLGLHFWLLGLSSSGSWGSPCAQGCSQGRGRGLSSTADPGRSPRYRRREPELPWRPRGPSRSPSPPCPSLQLSWDFSALPNWNHTEMQSSEQQFWYPPLELRGGRGAQRGQSRPVPEQFLCVTWTASTRGSFIC